MKRFRYRALGATGRMHRGIVEADQPRTASQTLGRRGLHVVGLSETDSIAASSPLQLRARARGVRAIAELTDSGLTLDGSLRVAAQIEADETQAAAAAEARRLLHEGHSASYALEAVGLVTSLQAALLRSAEETGNLSAALSRVAEQLDYEVGIRARVGKALTYPLVLLLTGFVSAGVILLVVVPRFAAVAATFGQQLPMIARGLLSISNALRSNAVATAVAASLSLPFVFVVVRTSAFQELVREATRQVPIVRGVVALWDAAAHLRSLATMLEAGMPLLRSMQVLRQSANLPRHRDAFSRVIARLTAGEGLVVNLARERLVPNSALPILELGEETGRLPATMHRVSVDLIQQFETRVEHGLTLLQPVLVLAIGGVISIVAAGMLQAMYSIRPAA